MTDTLDVLVIADDGDLHYLAVERALHLRGAQVKAWNLSTFRSTSMTFDGDRLLLEFPDGSSAIVDSTTTVWWRRVGRTPTEDLSTEEAALVRDENPHALIGCLDALGARWVDRPDVVARAERKLFQLAAMRANGIRTPRFVVTNSIEAAREFHKHDPVVTKALSPGEGIAPFTDRVTSHDIDQFIALTRKQPKWPSRGEPSAGSSSPPHRRSATAKPQKYFPASPNNTGSPSQPPTITGPGFPSDGSVREGWG